MKRKRRLIIHAVIFIVAMIFVIWVSEVIRCEVLTAQYGNELFDVCDAHPMMGPMEYIKVLDYKRNAYAKVYAVSEAHSNGSEFILIYDHDSEKWIIQVWLGIWSAEGSADGYIWPYIR